MSTPLVNSTRCHTVPSQRAAVSFAAHCLSTENLNLSVCFISRATSWQTKLMLLQTVSNTNQRCKTQCGGRTSKVDVTYIVRSLIICRLSESDHSRTETLWAESCEYFTRPVYVFSSSSGNILCSWNNDTWPTADKTVEIHNFEVCIYIFIIFYYINNCVLLCKQLVLCQNLSI